MDCKEIDILVKQAIVDKTFPTLAKELRKKSFIEVHRYCSDPWSYTAHPPPKCINKEYDNEEKYKEIIVFLEPVLKEIKMQGKEDTKLMEIVDKLKIEDYICLSIDRGCTGAELNLLAKIPDREYKWLYIRYISSRGGKSCEANCLNSVEDLNKIEHGVSFTK